MVKLTISNSMSQVENLPSDMEDKIKHELKYLSQNVAYMYHQNLREIERMNRLLRDGRFSSNAGAIEKEVQKLTKINKGLNRKMYVMLYKNGSFPTGLLPKVTRLLQQAEVPFTINDLRIKPKKGVVKFILRESFPAMRYYQRTAARLATDKGRGIIVAPTGTGKSLKMARMIWDLAVEESLIVTPSKAISDNMMDTLIRFFGKGKVTKLNSKSKKLTEINVCNIQSLVKIDPALFKNLKAVYIDEFHHSAAETYQEVNMNHLKDCYYRIGLTATNFRNDGSDLSLEAILSEVLYEYTIEQALKDGFLVKPEFTIVPTTAPDHGNYQTEYKEGIVNNNARNEKIAEIAKTHARDSVLILVQQVEHGEALKTMIPGAEFIQGKENDTQRQNLMDKYRKGQLKCLIGTTVIGEGVDLPIANVLIMAGGGKAKSQVMQNIGRVLRPFAGKTKATVYDFTDQGSRYLSEHSALRQEIYKMYDINTDKA